MFSIKKKKKAPTSNQTIKSIGDLKPTISQKTEADNMNRLFSQESGPGQYNSFLTVKT